MLRTNSTWRLSTDLAGRTERKLMTEIPVATFQPDRTLRRIARANAANPTGR